MPHIGKAMFTGCRLVETVHLNAYMDTMLRTREARLC